MSKHISVKDLSELIRFEFRGYGFRADGFATDISKDGKLLFISFGPEPATGQAKFSQKSCVCYATVRLREEDVANLPFPIVLSADDNREIGLDLGVSYTHWNVGSNGIAVGYVLRLDSFSDDSNDHRLSRRTPR